MINFLIIIALLVLAIMFLCFIINVIKTKHKLLDYFHKNSVIVFGSKGSGKDLLFQKVIFMKRKKKYFSNISYGYKGENIKISDLSLSPNTYKDFINNDITKIPRNENMEGADVYISDAGVHLPSSHDSELNKKYPSFPIYYALSRQLYKQNIHANTQALSRVWKQLREQADKYIKCIWSVNLLGVFLIKVRFFDKYESANNNLLPIKARVFNKISKAFADQYNATNGEIVNGFVLIRKRHIKYNTRHFKEVVFENNTPL